MLITVIGRGHSGTRAMSHTLSGAGVFMGEPINPSGDLVPAAPMYDACRLLAPHVRWLGERNWDFQELHDMPIPQGFIDLLSTYLQSVTDHAGERKGWKIPETTLAFPWLCRLYPHARYIFWIRDPRDCVIGGHVTDDLRPFGVSCPVTDDERERRAISWLYQYQLVKATPRPKHWIEVRFEDFVLRQEETLARLETFLGFSLPRIDVHPESVGRWKLDPWRHDFPFFKEALSAYGYEQMSNPCEGGVVCCE